MSRGAGGWKVLGRAIGRPVESLMPALGEPVVRRRVGGDLWLVFVAPGRRLRVRCNVSGGTAEVAAWTVSYDEGLPTLREAAEPLGLWPAVAPDVAAERFEGRAILRAVTGPDAVHSLIAGIEHGRIRKITLFNEPPEWM